MFFSNTNSKHRQHNIKAQKNRKNKHKITIVESQYCKGSGWGGRWAFDFLGNLFRGGYYGLWQSLGCSLFSDFIAFFGNKFFKNVFNHYEKDNIRKTNKEFYKMCLKCSEFFCFVTTVFKINLPMPSQQSLV
jgi:hypothetical protein